MKRLIEWFATNGVAANLLMLVIAVGGLLTMPSIRQEVFPEFELNYISVSVPYPGAAPEEVEKSITTRIEERVASLEGVKKITSSAAEGAGAVTIQAFPHTEIRALLDDVKAQVDAIDTFPDDAEEPLVRQVEVRHRVVSVAVHGDQIEELTLKQIAERVRDDLTTLPEITQVELSSARPYEVSIEVSETEMRAYGLTFDDVARAVRTSSLDLPGGSVKTSAGEVLLRTSGQAYTGAQFEDIVLRTRSDGTRLHLRDVATVVDGFAETDQTAEFDGDDAVIVDVYRVGEQSALEISAAVAGYIEKSDEVLPAGVKLTAWNDDSLVLRSRLDMLRRNGLQGLLLVFVSLALFLQFRLAIWTTIGIPVSFLGAVWLMPTFGVSVNVLSLFSFILVLGIVVDDAIVVGENVVKKQEEGLTGLRAAVDGTYEVSVPVIFGVLTTVAVFCPMLMVPGITGNIMKTFPSIVIPTLLFSLVESKLILPSHLKHVILTTDAGRRGIAGAWKRVQGGAMRGLRWVTANLYRPALERALEWRYATLAVGLAVLMFTGAVVSSGWLRVRFFPEAEADHVVANLTMPQGTPASVTSYAIGLLRDAAVGTGEEFDAQMAPDDGAAIRHMFVAQGDQSQGGGRRSGSASNSGSHLGQVTLQLAPSELRSFSSSQLAKRWSERTGQIPDVVELSFVGTLVHGGDAIDIELSSNNIEHLRDAAVRLKSELSAYPGVRDVADSFRPGKQELQLAIKPEAESLGLTLSALARQVRQAFYGEEAQRVQRGREDLRVMVRYPAEQRRSLADVENMRIRTPDGSEVAFSTVATVEHGRGYATIKRSDRQRVVNVTADVDTKTTGEDEVLAELADGLLPQLMADYPGLRYSLEGQQRERNDSNAALMRGMIVSLFVIYALMAIPLGSYYQPFIVMTAIPFGIAGAIWAHLMLGMTLSFMSSFGIVALVGVVVNDSLVLVDYVNRHRDDYPTLRQVVAESGVARFRPIMLTSLTTFAGLTPLLLERSYQAQFVIPMAVSLGFGVLFATGVSLVIVPCTYLAIEDVVRLLSRRSPEPEGGDRESETRVNIDRLPRRDRRRGARVSREGA